MNKVNSNSESNKYCGPAALSVITGLPVDQCANAISVITRQAPDKIKGVQVTDLIKAAKNLRVDCERINTYGQTLFGAAHYLHKKPGLYLVVVTGHYVVLEVKTNGEILLCDNHTKEPIKVVNSARLSMKVVEIYQCKIRKEPKFSHTVLEIDYNYIDENNVSLIINRIAVYEDRDDNFVQKLGSIRCTLEELKSISQEIEKHVEDHRTADSLFQPHRDSVEN